MFASYFDSDDNGFLSAVGLWRQHAVEAFDEKLLEWFANTVAADFIGLANKNNHSGKDAFLFRSGLPDFS
jgi:hypothetical protein